MTEAQRVARNSAVQLAGRGVTIVVSLAALTILSRYLGPTQFGQYQLIIAFLTLFNISDLGVATIATRHLATSERDPDELMGNVLAIRLVLALASSVLVVGAAFLFEDSAYIKAGVAIAALSFPLTIFSGSYSATFAANLRMEYATIGNIAQAVVGLAAMTFVVMNGGGLLRLIIAYDLGILANSLVCLYFARHFVKPRLHWDMHYSRKVLREALPLGLAVLIITAYGRIDIVLLKWFTDSTTVGYYGFAYRAVDLAFPLSWFFVGSIFPLLSMYHNEGKDAQFRSLYQRSHDILSLGGMGIVTGLVLFSDPFVHLIGGGAYDQSVKSLQVLSLAIAIIWLSNLADHGLIAVGRQSALLWIALFGLVINLSSNLILIPLYDKEGAAAATVITEVAVLLPALVIVGRYIKSAPSFWVAGRLLPVAGVAAVAVYGLKLPWQTEALLAGALFGIGVAVMRIISRDDISILLRKRDPAVDTPAPQAATVPSTVEMGTPQ
jgi:O-antigen/teichoic acid export membrane protein